MGYPSKKEIEYDEEMGPDEVADPVPVHELVSATLQMLCDNLALSEAQLLRGLREFVGRETKIQKRVSKLLTEAALILEEEDAGATD